MRMKSFKPSCNLATIRDWPLVVSLADLAWGMIITTAVSLAGYFTGKRFS